MSSRKREGPRCQSVQMSDGNVVLVRLKPGAELTAEDEAVLREFYEHLRIKKPPDREAEG